MLLSTFPLSTSIATLSTFPLSTSIATTIVGPECSDLSSYSSETPISVSALNVSAREWKSTTSVIRVKTNPAHLLTAYLQNSKTLAYNPNTQKLNHISIGRESPFSPSYGMDHFSAHFLVLEYTSSNVHTKHDQKLIFESLNIHVHTLHDQICCPVQAGL